MRKTGKVEVVGGGRGGSDVVRPTPQQLTGDNPSGVSVVTDFTIFKTVKYGSGVVVTGWKFPSNDETSAQKFSFCYYDDNPIADVSETTYLFRRQTNTCGSTRAGEGGSVRLVQRPTAAFVVRETPNNTSVAVGIGGCGIILDAGAAENGLRR